MRKKFSFTLAEVLITLSIIGIVAAMTIPNLMQNWEKQARIAQVKVAKSILSQAFTMAVAEHGPATDWDWDDKRNFAGTYIFPYLKTAKVLSKTALGREAQEQFGQFTNPYYLQLDTTVPLVASQDDGMKGNLATLANGMLLGVVVGNSTWEYDENDNLREPCITAKLFIDVNGSRGKTMLGNDVFVYTIYSASGKFMADGGMTYYKDDIGHNTLDEVLTKAVNGGCNTQSISGAAGPGHACARVLELNGWKFPDDYPIRKF